MFDEAEARRNIQIRNRVRGSNGLPLLDVEQEVTRLRETAEREAFTLFSEQNQDRAYAEVMSRYPGYDPQGLANLAIGKEVKELLQKWYGELAAD